MGHVGLVGIPLLDPYHIKHTKGVVMANLDIEALNNLNMSKQEQLSFHLRSNFYPQLPDFVITTFINAFKRYWDYLIDIEELQIELSTVYNGDLSQYGFYNFLNDEDLEEDY